MILLIKKLALFAVDIKNAVLKRLRATVTIKEINCNPNFQF